MLKGKRREIRLRATRSIAKRRRRRRRGSRASLLICRGEGGRWREEDIKERRTLEFDQGREKDAGDLAKGERITSSTKVVRREDVEGCSSEVLQVKVARVERGGQLKAIPIDKEKRCGIKLKSKKMTMKKANFHSIKEQGEAEHGRGSK